MDTTWVEPAGGIVLIGFGLFVLAELVLGARSILRSLKEEWDLRKYSR